MAMYRNVGSVYNRQVGLLVSPEAKQRYDWLLATPLSELQRRYIYMLDTGDGKTPGDVIQWDELTGDENLFLSRLRTMDIETAYNLTGALRKHFGLMFFGTPGGGMPVLPPPTEIVEEYIEEKGIETGETPGTIPDTTTDTTPTPPATTTTSTAVTTVKDNIVPIALTVGTATVALYGDKILKKRKKLFFLGGIAALFYFLAKKQA